MNSALPAAPIQRRGHVIASLLATVALAVEPLAAAEPLTARFVPPSAVAAVVARPRQALARLPDAGEAFSLYAVEAARWSLLPRDPARSLLRVVETCGFLLNEVEEIGFVLLFLDSGAAGGERELLAIHVIRFVRPVDADLVGDLFRTPVTRFVGGVKTFRDDDRLLVAALIDDRSLLLCPAQHVEAVLTDAAGDGPVDDALLRGDPAADIVGAFSPAGLPPEAVPPDSPLVGLVAGECSIRLGIRPEARGTATFADATGAERGARIFAPWLQTLAAAFSASVDAIHARRPGPPVDGRAALESMSRGVAGWLTAVEVRCENERLAFSAVAPADRPLPADVAPLMLLPDVAPAAAAGGDAVLAADDAPADDSDSLPSRWQRFDVEAARRAREELRANPVAFRLRNRVPAATGFDTDSFLMLANSETTPARDLPDQPVSLLAFTGNFFATARLSPDRDRSLTVHRSRPAEIAVPFTETLGYGYASLIRLEDVTRVTCELDGDAAHGTVEFQSDLARGEARYRAARNDDRWTFTELELPGWRMACTRRPDGTWALRSDLGPYGAEPRGHEVELRPTWDGKPVNRPRLILLREPQFDEFDTRVKDDGRITATLPPGRYLVQALGDGVPDSLWDDVRADGPAVTIPAAPPREPISVELNGRGAGQDRPVEAGR